MLEEAVLSHQLNSKSGYLFSSSLITSTTNTLPSRVRAVLNLVAIPKSDDTMKRATLPLGSIWSTEPQNATSEPSDLHSRSFFSLPFPSFNFSFGVPPRRSRKKQQLVTPYGREWRGRFEQLPAWTPPYAVEFDCLLSLINGKRDAMLLAVSVTHLFSPRWGRCSNPLLPIVLFFSSTRPATHPPNPWHLPSCHAEQVLQGLQSTCLSFPCVGCI